MFVSNTWQPYKCPVCGGRGFHAPDFYIVDERQRAQLVEKILAGEQIDNAVCRSCFGQGVLWK